MAGGVEGILESSVGTDTLGRSAERPLSSPGAGGDGRVFPRPGRSGAQYPETWSGDQVRLDIEGVVDGEMAGEEPLG